MGQLIGKYKPQGSHVTYEYEVTWRRHTAGLGWNATVTTAGILVLRPSGITRVNGHRVTEAFVTPESLVRRAVESSIEQLVRDDPAPPDPGNA